MANTGVLPFVRGVDFSRNDFGGEHFPSPLSQMTGAQWLKLDCTNLSNIPKELGNLGKLEHLSLTRNNLEKLYGELTDLHCLRTLILRHNNIKSSGVPADLFTLEELTTLDLSHNNLKEVPEGLERAKSLLVLNLSNNHIESIPNALFINLTELLFLDLSDNRLETLPPQTRRLANLQTLILNNNPLGHFQLRQLPSLLSLETLCMRNTQRHLNNFPNNLDNLISLCEIDLSNNVLTKVPESLYALPNLKRLNMSANELTELSTAIEMWSKLESLNVSHNKLRQLPATICKLANLRRLFVNGNLLDFEGIPAGIGKLGSLEVFSASNNQLEMIPEGLCRCGSLKKLNLSCNKLITLPDTVHFINDLVQIDLRENPDLVMPPKPQSVLGKGAGLEFYNIDFSLQNQLRLAGANVPIQAPTQNSSKDPIARKMRLRRKGPRDHEEADQDQAKILKGMKEIAKEKQLYRDLDEEDLKIGSLKPKRWDEVLEKPQLDYSEFFDDDAGQSPGITIWEIENFLPNRIDEVAHGKFYEGDCYIVLKTTKGENETLAWEIYFWIGEKATLDKKACAAIHAVHLRNFLGAQCRTIREEQGDESEEFLNLFTTSITYIGGGRTCSGFFTVEDNIFETRLYRVHGTTCLTTIHLEPVAVAPQSLDPRYVFILDHGLRIYLWNGKKAKLALKSKARLLCEKINKNERKNKAELVAEVQGNESKAFVRILKWHASDGGKINSCMAITNTTVNGNGELMYRVDGDGITDDDNDSDDDYLEPACEHVPDSFVPTAPRLYKVQLGMGYLELPQVEIPHGKLTSSLLNSKNVYILDCYKDVFVWIGKKSTRLVNAAAMKLSEELFRIIDRPPYALITRMREATESQIFKCKFVAWDEVIAVDFTRTAASVQKTGADLTKWAQQQETKADLTALFAPRQPSMPLLEAQQLMEEWNEDLDVMDALVLEGKKFSRLPDEELGHFYSMDCYVFLCKYWVPIDSNGTTNKNNSDGEGNGATEIDDSEGYQCDYTVYFWQGRDASNMGWLTFTFTLKKKFKALFNTAEVEVVRIHQQQENMKFMAHFKRKFIIHQGKRPNSKQPINTKKPKHLVKLYHLRSNGSALYTRLVQIPVDASLLNSAFCYILSVPFEQEENSGIIYVWIGSKATAEEAHLIQEIAEERFNNPWVSLQVLAEGEEPENFFWLALGGRKPYDTDATFMEYTRLFRCSNEKGYFIVSEKCSDFCQDDLVDDDIMILDNGEQVFLWLGSKCSEVEIKLAYKSAQVYIQHMRAKQPNKPRKLFLTLKNKESKRFTKCFHGWAAHKKSLE